MTLGDRTTLWDNGAMGKVALDIKRLSRDEQLDLLDQLWESLGRDPEAFPLTDSQREELDRRLDELEAEGRASRPAYGTPNGY